MEPRQKEMLERIGAKLRSERNRLAHGVGIGKRKFMQQEHGFGIEIMRSIKQCFDPKGILNTGKILP